MKNLLYVFLLSILFGCSENEDPKNEIDYLTLMEGSYDVDLKHYINDRKTLYTSEHGQIKVEKDLKQPWLLNVILFNDTITLNNLQSINEAVVFDLELEIEEYDEFGNKYLLKPSNPIVVDQLKFSGSFLIDEQILKIYLLKEYLSFKQNDLNGYVDLEAKKKM